MSDEGHRLPDTPAGRQLGWWLAAMAGGGEGVTSEDWSRFASPFADQLSPERTAEALREFLSRQSDRMGQVVEHTVKESSSLEITVVLRTSKDRKLAMKVQVAPDPPHPISHFNVERLHDFQLEVREAGPDDALTVADIERRCPIVMGDTSVWFDRGERYFDFARLMEDSTVGLASVDGVPAAISCGAERRVLVGGQIKQMVTVSHLRVLPEHQRKGLWGAANSALNKYWDHVNGSQAYISVDNAGMQHGFANTPDKWPLTVSRIELDCAALAGPDAGRTATPDDASAIVRLLNGLHRGEELFVPYDERGFARRVERAPDLYGWDKLRLTDGAVVGVWAAGQALKTVTSVSGVESVSLPGVVMDYGFAPGAEAELEALLRGWCATLATAGLDTLVIYSSPTSGGSEVLRALARSVGEFFTWTPGIPVPPGAESRGLYTDAVYF